MIHLHHATVAGIASEIELGFHPMRWMAFVITSPGTVWDTNGRRATVKVRQRVVLQGKENVLAFQKQILEGTGVFIQGQTLPAFAVANDAHFRGNVVLAAVCQIQESTHDQN